MRGLLIAWLKTEWGATECGTGGAAKFWGSFELILSRFFCRKENLSPLVFLIFSRSRADSPSGTMLRRAFFLLASCSVVGAATKLTLAQQKSNMMKNNETCADLGLLRCPQPFKLMAKLSLPAKQLENIHKFGKADTSTSEPSLRCQDIVGDSLPTNSRVYPRTKSNLEELTNKYKHTFIMVTVPPHWGSTGLEGLLASSPHVSNMCGAHTWACEGTWLLSKAGLFDHNTRWLPNYTDWDAAFEIFHAKAWNLSKHFLMDKSPPNVAKIPELVDYFERNHKNYYFVTMSRHPCYFDIGKHPNYYEKAVGYLDGIPHIPPERHVHLVYEEAMLNPEAITQHIIDRIPALEYLDYGVNGMTTEVATNKNNQRSQERSFKSKNRQLLDKALPRGGLAQGFSDVVDAEWMQQRALKTKASKTSTSQHVQARLESWWDFSQSKKCSFTRKSVCYDETVAKGFDYPLDFT